MATVSEYDRRLIVEEYGEEVRAKIAVVHILRGRGVGADASSSGTDPSADGSPAPSTKPA